MGKAIPAPGERIVVRDALDILALLDSFAPGAESLFPALKNSAPARCPAMWLFPRLRRSRGFSSVHPIEGIALGWKVIRDMKQGGVFRTVMDDTLPGGPVERTIMYEASFDRCDREADYAAVWVRPDELGIA